MSGREPGLWLAGASRFADLPRGRARLLALCATLLVLACYSALGSAVPPAKKNPPSVSAAIASDPAEDDDADVILYGGIVDAVRRGEPYYPAAAAALRGGGYPLRPFVTFRLPALAEAQGHLPPLATPVLLFALALASAAAWWRRLAGVFRRSLARVVALLLLLAGPAPYLRPELAVLHEVWAGLLISLSLALWRPGRATAAVALALCAMLVRETAALYAAAMAGTALVEGRRRELAGWAAAMAVFAVVVAAHAHAVSLVVHPLDTASPGGAGMLGVGFFVYAVTVTTALVMLPLALAAPLVGLMLLGWAGWDDPLGTRVGATLVLYALLVASFCRADTYYWVLLIAPVVLAGLAFAPDALADLWRAARERRRYTVTRTAR